LRDPIPKKFPALNKEHPFTFNHFPGPKGTKTQSAGLGHYFGQYYPETELFGLFVILECWSGGSGPGDGVRRAQAGQSLVQFFSRTETDRILSLTPRFIPQPCELSSFRVLFIFQLSSPALV